MMANLKVGQEENVQSYFATIKNQNVRGLLDIGGEIKEKKNFL